ncbi:MAG: ABC transporter ATP-binding protein [Limosilactobacillus sp.]|uniref:ABC transporter ATP-binding protein n=1 Tax=Limosilactobacillus sp. TaxID=2773925 RepID=UPI00270CFB1C|nr:ABC transporter ATP-binding protein [Limosilactobacillus sp.]
MEQLRIDHITKLYGRRVVLDDISFTLQPGKIYGLLGRNGAGKTTLLNIITNRIFATSGKISLGDTELKNDDEVIGQFFLMSEHTLYSKQTKIKKMFDLADASYGKFDYQNAQRQLGLFGLQEDDELAKLSTGLQTIAKVIVALNVNASYIFLDEPVLGLDANHRELFYKELIQSYQDKPRTFILSTHLIEEIQQLVEHVLVLHENKILADEEVEAMLSKAYAISGPEADVDQYVEGLNVIGSDKMGNMKTAYVYDKLDDMRVIPDRVQINHIDLQHLFIQLTNGGAL